ncbi:MAG: MgtC/SapB family protein [Peptococcaceae bacterium]|nr:MgtC/SapB family protein [Peptococcaceae bacterium]
MLVDLIEAFYYEDFWKYEMVYCFRLIMALVLGSWIGMERQWKKGKTASPAGLRTHILVTMGACIFTLVSISMPIVIETMGNGIVNNADPGRIAAQVVSGIGFIGAGAILQSKGKVHGLTTAASLWVAAAIGVAVGSGLYFSSVVATILTLVTLRWFSSLEIKANEMLAKRTPCYCEKECVELAAEIGAENVVYIEKHKEKPAETHQQDNNIPG